MPEVASALGASRATVGECNRCHSIVGEFFNLFHRVPGSSSYYLPALLGSWSSRLTPMTGSPRTASPGSDLESWARIIALRFAFSCSFAAFCVAAVGCLLLRSLLRPRCCCCRCCCCCYALLLPPFLLTYHRRCLHSFSTHADLRANRLFASVSSSRWVAPSAAILLAYTLWRPQTTITSIDVLFWSYITLSPPFVSYNCIPPTNGYPYSGRDLFQLSRIALKCEISPGVVEVVKPHLETLPAETRSSNHNEEEGQSQSPPVSAVSRPSSPSPSPSPRPNMANAEVDARPPPELVHRQNPLPQVESNRLPPPMQSPGERPTLPSIGLTQKSPLPSRSPAVMPVHRDEQPYAQPLPRESPAGLANRSRETLPPILHSPSQTHHSSTYPTDLDAIGRMQTQISQNTGALSAHARRLQDLQDVSEQQLNGMRREFHDLIHANMSRLGEMVTALQRDVQTMRQQVADLDDAMDKISRTVSVIQAQGPGALAAGSSAAAQASALELMAQQLHNVSTKVNEVDSLKINMEIMKGRIQRLEEGTGAASTQTVLPHPQYAVTSYGSTPTPATHAGTPVHEHAESAQPAQTFTAINGPPKRVYSYAEEHPDADQRPDSSKRLKIATMEPGSTYTVSQHHHSPQEQPHSEDPHARPQFAHSHSQVQSASFASSHTLSHDSMPPESTLRSSNPTSTLPSQGPVTPAYYTQDAPSDESWRPLEQRSSTRGRPRGGPGSRGGRGRKSLPAQLVHSTPEWERDDWQGVPESQISPNGYYTGGPRAARGTSVIRRGSGGAAANIVSSTPRGRPPNAQYQQQPGVHLGMQGVTPGLGSPGSLNGTPIRMMSVAPGHDPYAHTKKTRTKPTRNADGVLIRKDGRPDMRSHSSAANLRKVHAKKENAAKERRGSGLGPWGEESASPPAQGTRKEKQEQQQGTETPGRAGSPAAEKSKTALERGDEAEWSDPQMQKHHSIMKRIARGLQDWENIDPGKALRQEREGHGAHPEDHQQQQQQKQRSGRSGSKSEKDKENARTAVNGRGGGIKQEHHDERRVVLDSQDGDEEMLTSEREERDEEPDVDMRDRPEEGNEDRGGSDGDEMRSPMARSEGGEMQRVKEKEGLVNGGARDGGDGAARVVAAAEEEGTRE
ncbi:uncharacterized protein EI97DRAFT_440676 [Westerdykella ornata]|uniref:Uncharacterized protein n=1 Tax=Westerdykella ornata TaxID=318751 RepID=A0A6A6JPH5_WESOR|nr:uncharacterized protein EI97DRAFT_440676 [Westerdykella ornata]KAF2278164.1 hypothetical protein EI97DRAFT_440676 [Westerdykella ornata]